MNENKRIAVIIPAFNAAAFIVDAVTSVLKQSRPATEVFVVDEESA
jgi:glycosyltransferase involved in cell wall biosynthesis